MNTKSLMIASIMAVANQSYMQPQQFTYTGGLRHNPRKNKRTKSRSKGRKR